LGSSFFESVPPSLSAVLPFASVDGGVCFPATCSRSRTRTCRPPPAVLLVLKLLHPSPFPASARVYSPVERGTTQQVVDELRRQPWTDVWADDGSSATLDGHRKPDIHASVAIERISSHFRPLALPVERWTRHGGVCVVNSAWGRAARPCSSVQVRLESITSSSQLAAGCLDGRELILGKSLDGSQVSALSVGQNGEMTLHMRHCTSYIFMSIYSSLSIYLDDDRSNFTSHEDPETFFLFAEGQRSC
jgi:hypothetical protein